MPVTQMMSVVGRTGGGSPPPPYSGTDFFYAPDQNNWIAFGGLQSGSAFSNPAPANPAYVPPDGSYTGKTLDFTGSEWMISTNLGFGGAWTPNGGSVTVNLWFYPTANNCQIMSELGEQSPTAGYHYSMLEINSSGNIKAKFWQTGPEASHQIITSNNTVILNQWNHIRFAEDTQGGHYLELNGIATNSQTYYTRLSPGAGSEFFAIGISDATHMATTNRFQGKIGYIQISDYLAPSTYTANFSRFKSINTGVVLGTSWTIELIAELVPTSFWASIWGNENFNTSEGHVAFFNGAVSLNVGSPISQDAYNVTGIDQKGYWAFSHANGGGISMYRNGVLVNPNVAGYVQGQPAANTLLIGARHLNSGGGGSTDPCPGNYYYTNVTNGTALDATAILASYNSLKTTYGLP